MFENETYEYAIRQKIEGVWIFRRIGLCLLYVLFVCAWLLFGLRTRILVPLLALIPISTWILIFVTWRYVNVEYECSVTSGILTFAKIYGGRSRKKIFELSLRDAIRIAPLSDDGEYRRVKEFRPERSFSGVSSLHDEHVFFMLFELKGKSRKETQRAIFYFEANEKMCRMCRYYNPSATVLSKNAPKSTD